MNLELGQMLWSGQDIQKYEAYWASEGLAVISQALASIDEEYDGIGGNAACKFENDTFLMQDYCWCDGENKGHENGCPPNFVHKPSGLIFTWYKHFGRGITSNKKLNGIDWASVIVDCINSLKDKQ